MMLLTGRAWAVGAETPTAFPGEAEGEIRFVADAGLFLDSGGREEVYCCLAVPQAALRCVERRDTAGSWAELDLRLASLSLDGTPLQARSSFLELPCVEGAADGPGVERLVHLRAPWSGGLLRVELRLEDRNALRTGLVYQLEHARRRGILSGTLTRPLLRDGRGMSSCLFLWDLESGSLHRQDEFLLGPVEEVREQVEFHPSRYYGLLAGEMVAYVELYGLDGPTWRARTQVKRGSDGTVLFDHEAELTVEWPRCALVRSLDVRQLPPGAYVFELQLTANDQGATPLRTAGRFQMVWRPESWSETQGAMSEEARLLLEHERWVHFSRLEPGAREAFLDSLWMDADGAAMSGLSEGPTRARFLERVATADARYGGRRRGSLSDRGRVYVRFGEPDEIHKELQPLERDRITRYLARELSEDENAESGDLRPQSWLENSAYEVWYYVNRGEPLFPEAEVPGGGRPLRFIFLDRLGNGEFRLIYSNLFGGIE